MNIQPTESIYHCSYLDVSYSKCLGLNNPCRNLFLHKTDSPLSHYGAPVPLYHWV